MNENNENKEKNSFAQSALVVLGVIVLCAIIIYLMDYFFVQKNDIKINMSTDKKVEYVTINSKEELITTQKYVSDLNYTMRYDINNFSMFKYRNQDFFRYKSAEKILVIVEKSSFPESCSSITTSSDYDNCLVKVDNYTKEYYIRENDKTFKITVKTPNISEYEQNINVRINYMIKTFKINDNKELNS